VTSQEAQKTIPKSTGNLSIQAEASTTRLEPKPEGGWPEKFTAKYIDALPVLDRQYDKGERFTTGLRIIVYPSGVKSWRYVWARGKGVRLGKWPQVTVGMAREECGHVLRRLQAGEDPTPLYLRPAQRRGKYDRISDVAKPYKDFYRKLKRKSGFEEVRSLEVLDTVLKDIGNWRVAETGFSRIKQYRDGLLANNVARTINRKMQALHPMVVWGRETLGVWPDGDPFRNPQDGELLRPLPAGNRNRRERVRWISHEDEARIRDHIAKVGGHFEAAVTVALGTGMRPGEIFDMQWPDVRVNTIHIPKSKTGKERYATMDDAAKETLARLRGRRTTGSVLGVKSVKRQWNNLRAELDIDNVFHDCRHTSITRRRGAGMAWATLGELVGHSEAEMTDIYSFIDHELGLVDDRPREA
jgi:integrase